MIEHENYIVKRFNLRHLMYLKREMSKYAEINFTIGNIYLYEICLHCDALFFEIIVILI